MSSFYGLKELFSDKEFCDLLEHEVGDFLNSVSNSPKLYSNDLRHQYAAAVFTQMRGEKITRFLGKLNEFGGFSGRDDREIDLYNNDVGIVYGTMYPKLDRPSLLRMLYSDLYKNKLNRQHKIGK